MIFNVFGLQDKIIFKQARYKDSQNGFYSDKLIWRNFLSVVNSNFNK